MNLLGFDTSSANLSLAVIKEDRFIYEFNRQMKFGASKLITYIDKVCKRVSLDLGDFDAFVVGSGPGSFTGLRIAYSIIKALAYSLNKPIITIGSFWACAYPFRQTQEKIAVISDARKNLIYFAPFKSNCKKLQRETKEKLIALDDLPKKDYFFITYDEALRKKIAKEFSSIDFYPKDVFPKAKNLLMLAKNKYERGEFSPLDRLEPLYIHPKTCQIRKQK